MARTFAGTGRVVLGLGAGASITGAVTLAAIVKSSTDGASQAVVSVGQSSNLVRKLSLSAANLVSLRSANAAVVGTTTTVVAADGWCFIAVTKAAGTATARMHRYKYSTATWIHEAATATCGDSTPNLTSEIGGNGTGGTLWGGDIAVCGAWTTALTDAQVETLAFSLVPWFSYSPNGLWVLDQAATTTKVWDLTGGGANESTLVNTSVATSAVPVWNRGAPIIVVNDAVPAAPGIVTLTGRGAASSAGANANLRTNQLAAPISDQDTGSWTVAPLYAKIDETYADDSDSISSETLGVASTTSIAKIGLDGLIDPLVSTGHLIHVRAKATFTLGSSATITAELRQSGVLIATLSAALTSSYQTFTYTLSAGETDAITDYLDLSLWFTGTFTAGNLGGVQVSWADFETPPVASVEKLIAGTGTASAGSSAPLKLAASLAGHGDAASGSTAALKLTLVLAGHGDAASAGTANLAIAGIVALVGIGAAAAGSSAALRLLLALLGHGDAATAGTASITVADITDLNPITTTIWDRGHTTTIWDRGHTQTLSERI